MGEPEMVFGARAAPGVMGKGADALAWAFAGEADARWRGVVSPSSGTGAA